jgi:hypothetical protein
VLDADHEVHILVRVTVVDMIYIMVIPMVVVELILYLYKVIAMLVDIILVRGVRQMAHT